MATNFLSCCEFVRDMFGLSNRSINLGSCFWARAGQTLTSNVRRSNEHPHRRSTCRNWRAVVKEIVRAGDGGCGLRDAGWGGVRPRITNHASRITHPVSRQSTPQGGAKTAAPGAGPRPRSESRARSPDARNSGRWPFSGWRSPRLPTTRQRKGLCSGCRYKSRRLASRWPARSRPTGPAAALTSPPSVTFPSREKARTARLVFSTKTILVDLRADLRSPAGAACPDE